MDLKNAQRIVLKIGSATLADREAGEVRAGWLKSLAEDIAALHAQKKEILIVSSGAVALGRKLLGFNKHKDALKLEEKQAAAACGQGRLVEAYRNALGEHRIVTAQLLLTPEDTEDRRRYLNARNTIRELLARGVIPVINENDTVTTEELRFGDNDRLAARVAQMAEADILVLLSDVDGLYTADPTKNSKAEHIAEVTEITTEIRKMAGKPAQETGSGGMITKIDAAAIATANGCHTLLTLGTSDHPLAALAQGARHTVFTASLTPHTARKRWIAHGLKLTGQLIVDDGAVNALKNNKSLLPAGVKEVRGNFERGDNVAIIDEAGKEIARGLIAYTAEDAAKIIGHNSKEITAILGYSGRDALVHKDDLVLR